MKLPPINAKKVQSITHRMMLMDMRYGLGSKISPATPLAKCNGRAIDCSGFVRYVLYNSTRDHLLVPDGSWNQNAWFKERASRVDYHSVIDNPNELHVAFIRPTPEHKIGHVWFVREGWTFESHSGIGPNSRRWDTRILTEEVGDCYLLPHYWE